MGTGIPIGLPRGFWRVSPRCRSKARPTTSPVRITTESFTRKMTEPVFVDTGAWFALVVPSDPNHARAVGWLTANPRPLLTTDYIVDETLTLLRARGERTRALEIGDEFFNGNLAAVYRLADDDVQKAWEVFRDFDDKDWSFTDCTSKVVIEQMRIKTAFAFDRHFKQFGNVIVVP